MAEAPVTRGAATYAGYAAAALMIALIGAISLTGEWPTSGRLVRSSAKGLVDIRAADVTRVEVSAEPKDIIAFARRTGGGWRVNGEETEPAIARHIDDALRMLNVSSPIRTLKPDEYGPAEAAAFGLDPPRVLISVFAADGTADAVAFGEATPGENAQYVRIVGRPNLYLLPRYVGVEWQVAVDMAERSRPNEVLVGDTSPSALLLPVSMASVSAVEIVENGVLSRFERDPAGDWFNHFGQHTHGPGGIVHKADPKMAPLIAAELAALERVPVEGLAARHPDEDMLTEYGLAHPLSIMLLYTRDSSSPVAHISFGNMGEDGLDRYARVQETDAVVMVSAHETEHLTKLLKLAGAPP